MIEAWFDGSCEPVNPGGTAAWGIVVHKDGAKVYTDRNIVGKGKGMTNNVAEYCGLIAVIQYCDEAFDPVEKIMVRGDSQLVIRQMNGQYRAKSGLYIPYYNKARDLIKRSRHNWNFEWIPRERNQECDRLSKELSIAATEPEKYHVACYEPFQENGQWYFYIPNNTEHEPRVKLGPYVDRDKADWDAGQAEISL